MESKLNNNYTAEETNLVENSSTVYNQIPEEDILIDNIPATPEVSSSTSNNKDNGLTTGQIAMIVSISVVVVLLIAFFIYFVVKSGGPVKAVRRVGSSIRKSVSRRK